MGPLGGPIDELSAGAEAHSMDHLGPPSLDPLDALTDAIRGVLGDDLVGLYL